MDNENVSLSLDSIQFLTALATKLSLDLKQKWVEDTVQISERYGRIASFKDFALFVEEQARVAKSGFGLKLFQSVVVGMISVVSRKPLHFIRWQTKPYRCKMPMLFRAPPCISM